MGYNYLLTMFCYEFILLCTVFIVLKRASFETTFDSKQSKLVSALSETKRFFHLFRFYTETENFDVSIELKQTED
jgi:hypothetical protein